jgi:hypothetical protein
MGLSSHVSDLIVFVVTVEDSFPVSSAGGQRTHRGLIPHAVVLWGRL